MFGVKRYCDSDLHLRQSQAPYKTVQERFPLRPLAKVTGCVDVPRRTDVDQSGLPLLCAALRIFGTAIRVVRARDDDRGEWQSAPGNCAEGARCRWKGGSIGIWHGHQESTGDGRSGPRRPMCHKEAREAVRHKDDWRFRRVYSKLKSATPLRELWPVPV